MLNNINLNLLRSLYILLDECHVSRAAQRLNLTQSAVSRQLAQLRELTADPLLVREGNQLVPTPRAIVLKNKLVNLLGDIDTLIAGASFDPKQWQGEFIYASSDYVAQYIFSDIMAQLHVKAPLLNLAYRLWQPSMLSHFHSSGIHLATSMLAQKPPQVSSLPLGEDGSVCVMRSGHPLAGQDNISLEDFIHYAHIQVTGGGDKDSSTDNALGLLGYKRRIAVKMPFFAAAVNSLIHSDYLMVLPEHIAFNLARHQPLVARVLPFVTSRHHYWLMWHPKYDEDLAHQWVRNLIHQITCQSVYSEGMIYNHNIYE